MFRFGLSIFAVVLLFPVMVVAQVERYEKCMTLVNQQPLAAYEEALTWQAEEGGAPAKHCIASALLALGDLERGAERLEHLGHAPELQDNSLRAAIFAQAAEAFLQLGDAKRSLKATDSGLAIQASNTELKLGRARALDALGESEPALQELNSLLLARPDHVLGLMLRASSLLKLQRLDEAGKDVAKALKLAPQNVDVLLLRGQWREAKRLSNQ